MNEADQACDALRGEISRLRTHRMEMKSDARCAYTNKAVLSACLLYTSPSPRDLSTSRMPSSA